MTLVVNVLLSLQYALSISFCRRVCDVLVQRLALAWLGATKTYTVLTALLQGVFSSLIILVFAIWSHLLYPQIARAPPSLLSSSSSSCIPVKSALDQKM